MRRRFVWVLAVLVLGTLGLPASAHDKRFKSRVTIEHPSQSNYQGDVHSRKGACVRHRMVEFWLDNEGSPDKLVAEIEADAEGHWSFGFIGKAYYARVKRVVKRPGNHKHVCKGDRSPTV